MDKPSCSHVYKLCNKLGVGISLHRFHGLAIQGEGYLNFFKILGKGFLYYMLHYPFFHSRVHLSDCIIFIWSIDSTCIMKKLYCFFSFFFKVIPFHCFRISTVKHGPITDFKFPSCDVIRFGRARLAPVLVASPPPPSRVDVQLGLVSPFQSFPDVRICVTG